jgi:hypothetical protein
MNKSMKLALVALVAAAAPVMAQGKGKGNGGVPPGQRPPAGLCRVWIDGVPPGQQPAPTDCATAAATRPANARIIYGDRNTSNRGIFDNDGRVIRTSDGRSCVQRTDRDGRIRTTCDDDRDDDDRDGARDRDRHKGKDQGKAHGKGRGGEFRP